MVSRKREEITRVVIKLYEGWLGKLPPPGKKRPPVPDPELRKVRARFLEWIFDDPDDKYLHLHAAEAMLLLYVKDENEWNSMKPKACRNKEVDSYRLPCVAKLFKRKRPAEANEILAALKNQAQRRPPSELAVLKKQTTSLKDSVEQLYLVELAEDANGRIGILRLKGQRTKRQAGLPQHGIMVPLTLADMLTQQVWLDVEARQPVAAVFQKILDRTQQAVSDGEWQVKEVMLSRVPAPSKHMVEKIPIL